MVDRIFSHIERILGEYATAKFVNMAKEMAIKESTQ
jgi:hypothetical protein